MTPYQLNSIANIIDKLNDDITIEYEEYLRSPKCVQVMLVKSRPGYKLKNKDPEFVKLKRQCSIAKLILNEKLDALEYQDLDPDLKVYYVMYFNDGCYVPSLDYKSYKMLEQEL